MSFEKHFLEQYNIHNKLERYDVALLNKAFHGYPLTLNALTQEIKGNIERIKTLQGR